jgi:histidinol-phosphate aminotransferase
MKNAHGGPDALGVPSWDFSTNANACGPCPSALAAVQQADVRHYPDPAYTALRESLAAFHAVDAARIVLAGSASEFIGRFTAWMAREGAHRVWLPELAYGDYAHAAQAWRFERVQDPARAQLAWLCEPSSPLGQAEPMAQVVAVSGSQVVLDRAYEPLRLSGRCSLEPETLQQVWQLWTPNKAMGLTGVRGANAIAPLHALAEARALDKLAPSWPLGTHAVALLQAWVSPAAQDWLEGTLDILCDWKRKQLRMLNVLGWSVLPSEVNCLCALPPRPFDEPAMRASGIKLRETTSIGLLGHWRMSVLNPQAQDAFTAATHKKL